MTEDFFEGSKGRVFYRRWDPDGPPRRIVQIVHGYAEHGGRYDLVARTLASGGSVVYASDHLGHGRSDGERALIDDFEEVVDDLHRLAETARRDHPELPLILVGHSMGGLLAGRFAQRWPDEVAGVAFCGAVIGDWHWAREVLAEPDLPHIPFDPAALSRDPAVGAAYAADPLVYHGQYKRQLLEAEVAALDRFQAANDRLTMPVLFLHGTDDPFVPYDRSLQAVRDMPTADLTVHVYEGARHEVLNESNRDEVLGHLGPWVARFRTVADPHVGAIFADRRSAEEAVDRLRDLGLADHHLGVAVRRPESHVFEEDLGAEVVHGVERGVAIGAPIGALAGVTLLSALSPGTAAFGVGGILVAGGVAGAFIGTYLGGFLGFASEGPDIEERSDWERVELDPNEVLVVVAGHRHPDEVENVLAASGGRLIPKPTHV